MDLRQMIVSDYQERIGVRSDIAAELKRALKTHERAPLFVDNLVKEIKKIERMRLRSGRLFLLDRVKLKDLVYNMTDFFINNVKTVADERQKSEIEQRMIRDQSAEPVLDNQGNGKILDLEVEVVDGDKEGA